MGRKAEPLKVRNFINGEERSVFTPEELAIMTKRMGEAVSEHFRTHPDEWADYCRREGIKPMKS